MTAQQQLICLIPAAYLIGSIPFGLIVGLSKGVDPRKAGSGNIGATNVGRLLGGRFFAIVFTLDLLKGLLPMIAGAVLIANGAHDTQTFLLWLLVGFAAILGHMFSIFLKFTGGKGVATSTGVMLGLFPYFTLPGLVGIVVWLLIFLPFRYVSLASILGALCFPLAYMGIGMAMGWDIFGTQLPLLIFAWIMAGLIICKHRGNIARSDPARNIGSSRSNHRHRIGVMPEPQSLSLASSSAFKPLRGIFIIILAVAAVGIVSKLYQPRDLVPWGMDWDKAVTESRATHKPIFAYFTADWCGPCQSMRRTTWSDEKVAAALRQYVPLKLDFDQEQILVKKYQVDMIPAFFILNDHGDVIKQSAGAVEADDFLKWLKQ